MCKLPIHLSLDTPTIVYLMLSCYTSKFPHIRRFNKNNGFIADLILHSPPQIKKLFWRSVDYLTKAKPILETQWRRISHLYEQI